MNEAGQKEECETDEFPKIPPDFNGFTVTPSDIITLKLNESTKITLHNPSSYPILYKIKCTSNYRISILDCVGIILPEHKTTVLLFRHNCEPDATDRFLLIYTLLGTQWCTENANALLCWRRVKAQQIPTKSLVLATKLEKYDEELRKNQKM